MAPLKALIGEHAKGPQKFLKVPQNAKKAPAISFERCNACGSRVVKADGIDCGRYDLNIWIVGSAKFVRCSTSDECHDRLWPV